MSDVPCRDDTINARLCSTPKACTPEEKPAVRQIKLNHSDTILAQSCNKMQRWEEKVEGRQESNRDVDISAFRFTY